MQIIISNVKFSIQSLFDTVHFNPKTKLPNEKCCEFVIILRKQMAGLMPLK